MDSFIKKLSYGNLDTSSCIPFWLDSSLKISPKEQVDFLYNLFEGEHFLIDEGHIKILKNIMHKGEIENGTLFGKTGTSCKNNNAWFVGFYESDGKRLYFAIRLFEGGKSNRSTIGRNYTQYNPKLL